MLNLPGYRITTQIYESTHSLVYRARRVADDRAVVIKLLKAAYPTPQELVRYRQEYTVTSSLPIEGVIRAYNLEPYQNTFAIIFEDFGADSLTLLRQAGRLSSSADPLAAFLKLAIRIVEILGQVHQAHIIHKDINPSNIVLNPATGQVKLIDFGLSTRLPRENPVMTHPSVLE
ncbi:MAG TPA: protein kinase, partial [Anaerolineae bacterium]|nr:protein kinase [Anaerolineae bacterium]